MTAHPAAQVANFNLANGLEVVVIPDHRAPVVTHMVWYRNGAADDPPGKSGIAHFLEHLMFKGTEAHPKGEFSESIAEIGGQENAFTGNDYTAYFQRVAKEHLRTCMAFEADRMTGLVLTDEIVAPERDVVLEERRMHCDADPGAQLNEAVQATLFTHHPYGTPIIGWGHEIEGLEPRGRARLLPSLLHARERHPGRRRRRRAGRGAARSPRRHYGQVQARGERAEAHPPARAADRRRPAGDGERREGRAAELAAPSISRPPAAPPRPASRRRSKCSAICSAAARRACSIAGW